MPLPGGPTDKLGNRYELWWTVYQLVRMLSGQVESIRFENPHATKAEFVLESQGRQEHHQAKRSHHSGKWSLASLGSPAVLLLQGMYTVLSGTDTRFVFVSGSDARELAELTDRARQAASLAEFETKFLAAKEHKDDFAKLRGFWSNISEATAFDILKRIEVRTLDERSIENQVEWGLRALFLAEPRAIATELRREVEDSIHQTVTREVLIGHLAKHGWMLRRLAKLDDARTLVQQVTAGYLEACRRKLIRKQLVPRGATQALIARLTGSEQGSDSVLTGKAGAGKSGCVLELVESLQVQGTPMLAFRLDRLEPVQTTTELGQQLGLEESPVLVLAAAAGGKEAVLVVDQLDAVSTTSGRSADFLDAVEGLLAEARGLRHKLKLHVIVVCRAFDWENDHRLGQLVSDAHTRVEVAEFTIEEVKALLAAEAFQSDLFQPRQLELLRLPQNLALFLDAGFVPSQAPRFNTAKELFDRYWEMKRRAVARRATSVPDQWSQVVQHLCDEMTRTQQLSVLREKLDVFAPDYLAQMASEGVITFNGQRYGFGHESFFDYCFARAFVTRDQSLAEYLRSAEQHLFRRAQVRQVLAYLRDADRARYLRELTTLLNDDRIRVHLKDLTLALVTSVPDPCDDEWRVLEQWINQRLTALVTSSGIPDKFTFLAWHHFFISPSWFSLIDRRGLLTAWLASGIEQLQNLAAHYLQIHQRSNGTG
jgi:hypothetical protein